MTHPLIMTPPYSINVFMVKTFANCPETAKFVKVFTRERFPLYGTQCRKTRSFLCLILTCLKCCSYYVPHFLLFLCTLLPFTSMRTLVHCHSPTCALLCTLPFTNMCTLVHTTIHSKCCIFLCYVCFVRLQITQSNSDLSLEEAKLFPQEILYVEER